MSGQGLVDPLSVAYLEWLRAERVAANTIRARARVLRALGNAGVATLEDVEAWWAARRDLAPATRQNDLACLRTFYRWCFRWGHRDPGDDPTIRLDSPRVPNGLPRPVSRDELKRILAAVDGPERRAVCLGAYAGLRVSEAAALHWHDVDLERRRMRVLGKGQKNRLVPLGAVLLDELLPDTGANVVTGSRAVFSANALQVRINRAIKAAGVDATFHQLRHRFGTLAYQAEGDLLAVGRIMGHASPTTPAIYAASSDEVFDRIAAAVART